MYEAVFLASPGEALRMEYGSPDAEPGSYDTAALQAALLSSGTRIVEASLAPPREDTTAPTQPKWQPWNDPRLLIGGIVALAMMLGWGLYAASRRINPPTESATGESRREG